MAPTGPEVTGRVTYRGKEVPGAWVALCDQRTLEMQETSSDALGRFALGPVESGRYTLVAQAEPHAPALRLVDARFTGSDESILNIELGLQDCTSSVSGIVTDTNGQRVGGASIWYMGGVVGVATGEGAYHVCLPGGDHKLVFRAKGMAPRELEASVGGSLRRDMVMLAESVIVGVVRSPDGLVSATAIAQRMDDHASDVYSTVGPTNEFRLGGLSSGSYRVQVVDGSMVNYDCVGIIDVDVGATKSIECSLRPAFKVSGRLLTDGGPVVGAIIRLVDASRNRRAEVVSAFDGRFEFEGIESGEYRPIVLENIAPAIHLLKVHEPMTVRVEDAVFGLDVVVEARVAGTVRGRALLDGQPAAGSAIFLKRNGRNVYATSTDGSGFYLFPLVVPGEYSISGENTMDGACADGGSLSVYDDSEVAKDMLLERAPLLRGTVRDSASVPVPGVYVRLSLEGGEDYGTPTSIGGQDFELGMTDEHGAFSAGPLCRRGKYVVRIGVNPDIPDVALSRAGTTLVALDGKGEDAEIVLSERVVSISGAVRALPTRSSVSGTLVELIDASGLQVCSGCGRVVAQTRTDRNGEFRFERLLPRAYSVRAWPGRNGAIVVPAVGGQAGMSIEVP